MTDSELVAILDSRFDRIDQRFENMEKRFEKIDERFDQLGANVRHLGIQLELVRERVVGALGEKIDHVDERLERFKVEVINRFDEVEHRLDLIESLKN